MLVSWFRVNTRVWCTRLSGEGEGFFNGECGKVDVIFRAVLHVAAVKLLDVFGTERIVMDRSFDRVIFVPMVGEHSQECGTASARSAEDN